MHIFVCAEKPNFLFEIFKDCLEILIIKRYRRKSIDARDSKASMITDDFTIDEAL